jgi:hypothetical protein
VLFLIHDFLRQNKDSNEEILFAGAPFAGAPIPRQISVLWVEFLQGSHPTMEEFGPAREQLNREVKADPTNPWLMKALAYADVALGRKEESIREGRRGMELLPISEDADDGSTIAGGAAQVYAWADEPDFAFEQLNNLVHIPALLSYGDLKTNPGWDPLRKDPRFDKLLAQLAPRE